MKLVHMSKRIINILIALFLSISAISLASVVAKGGSDVSYATETKYKIVYVLNGGTNNKDNVATYKSTWKVPLKEPTRTGYTFAGWFKDSKFTKPISYIKWEAPGKGLSMQSGPATNTTLYLREMVPHPDQ